MARLIENTLKKPLADQLLFGRLKGGGSVTVTVEDGKIVVK
jgi:ATP-dependent Clp protease ATP-binding subunit ClpA